MSPIITTSFNDIANQANQRRIKTATLQGISLQNEVLFNSDLLEVKTLIEQITNKIGLYQYKKFIYNLDFELFTIAEQQFKNKEITPLQYISAKQTYMNSMYNIKASEIEIIDLINECNKTAKQTIWSSLPASNNHK